MNYSEYKQNIHVYKCRYMLCTVQFWPCLQMRNDQCKIMYPT